MAFDPDSFEKALFSGAYDAPPPAPVEAVPAVKQNTSALGDFGTGLKRGVEQIPGMVTGLADIPFAAAFNARPFTQGAEAVGRYTGFEPGKWAEEAQKQYSPQYQQSAREVNAAWEDPNASLLEKTGAVLAHPRYLAGQITESLPSMAIGGVGSRALMTAGRVAMPAVEGAIARTAPGYLERAAGEKWATPVAAGIGEGGVQAGQFMEQGKGNEDQRKVATGALMSGAVDALIGIGAGRAAQKMGLETVETRMARGLDNSVKTELSALESKLGRTGRIAGGALSEGVLQELPQSAQEQVWQNWTEKKPLWEGVPRQAIEGMLAGAAMGAGVNIRGAKTHDLTKPAQTVDYTHADGSVEKMDPWTAAYNDAEREVAGTADTGWTPETSKAHADYVRSGGAERTYAEAAPTDNVRPYDPEARQRAVSGLMQTEEGTQNLIDYHKSLQQSPAVDQAVSALEDHLTELKKIAASAFSTKQPITPRGSLTEKGVQTQKSLLSHQIGEYLGKGLITPEQHMDFVNDLAQPGVKTLKVKSDVLKAIKDTRSAKVAEMQARKDAVDAEIATKRAEKSATRRAARAAKKAVAPTKEAPNAVQKRIAAQEVSPAGKPREAIAQGGEGVGQGKQGIEAAFPSEAEKEVKGPKLKAKIAVAKGKKVLRKHLDALRKINPKAAEAAKHFLDKVADSWPIDRHIEHVKEALRNSEEGKKIAAKVAAGEKKWSKALKVGDEVRLTPEAMNDPRVKETAGDADTFIVTGSWLGEVHLKSADTAHAATVPDLTTSWHDIEEKVKVAKEKISAKETTKTKSPKAQQQETPAAALAADVKAAEAAADKEIARKKQVTAPTKTIQALAKEHSDLHNALGRAEEEEDFGAQLEVMDKLKKFASDNKADMKAIEAARARFEDAQETAEEHIPEVDAYGNETDEKTDWDNRHSESTATSNPTTAGKLTKTLKDLFRGAALFDKTVKIYATQEDAAVDGNLSGAKGRVLGFKTPDGKVGLIAENIEDGKELGVFLHEVGVHLGMEKLVGKANMRWLDSRILEWSALNDGSRESEAAKAAVARSEESTTDDNAEGRIAYMTEEMVNRGVNPKATVGGIEGWLYRLIGSMRIALVKLGLRSAGFSGQNLVDLAHGAAGIELGVTSRPTELSPERQGGLKFSEKTASVGNEAVINSFLTSAREHIPTAKSEFVKYAAMMPFTRDLAKWASKYMPAANNLWDAINSQMSDTRKLSLDVHAVSQSFLDLKPSGQDFVQHFLHDGKMSGKWGFQPEWLKNRKDADGKPILDTVVPISPEMAKAWNELKASDKQAANVAEATLKLFHTLRQEEIKAVQTSVEDFRRYADSLQDPETQKSALADVNNQLAALRLLASYQGPYVPTLRFGDYYVKAKSAAYLAAEAAEDVKAMTVMKADGKNYVYTHVQSQSAANALAKDLSAKYAGGKIEALPIKGRPEARKADYTALLNLESLLKKNADKKGAGQVREMLNTLLNAMSDEHAESQSRQQFKAVYGANYKETMRGAAMRGQQMAFKIGALKNARKASNALFDMGKQADDENVEDKASATHLLNEFRKRYEGGLDGTETSNAIQSILGGVSLWKLLTNPMYYLTQLAQPYQYSIPSMVKYGLGYNASWKAMFDERKTLLEVWKKSGGVFRVDEDLSWVKNAKERGMLEWLRERNLLDMGMESEVGALEGANPAKQAIEKWAFRPLRNAVQNTEIVNRVSTALAAYKLAIRQEKTENQAREIVENVLHESHGQYAGTNAPRYLNQKGAMRIPMQFRKFQLIQATFLFQNIWREVQKLPDPIQRAAAARTIAATLGHTLAVAGLRGSVLWLVVQALVTAAGIGAGDDDKDPRDVETKVHDWLSDNASPAFANFVMFGAPTVVGVNISARMGLNPLTVLPFDNQSVLGALSSMKDFKENAFALGFGAAGSTAADMIDGFDMMSQGKIYKGAEKMAPSAIKNLMQAGRYATEGVTKRNGDVTMRPEEVTWWDTTQQALGAPSASVKEIQRKTGAVHDITTNFKTEADKLKSDYVSAFEDKDVAGMKDARDEWMSMSASMRKLGLKPQPITTMLKAPMEKRKRERNVVSGVETSKQTRGLLQNVS